MSYFDNKVVWITGASSGIGEALAYTFAKHPVKLVLSARRADELARVKAACGLPDQDVLILPLDVSEHSLSEAAAQKVIAHFGKVDILVNNAGLSHWSKIKDLNMEVIKIIMNVNFLGAVSLTKAVLPDMLKRKAGNIVVVSSILGKIVTPKQAAYNASKHALMGFFDTLRAETTNDGIKVLLVCPGFVRTNVAKNSLNKEGVPINKDNNMIAHGLDPLYVSDCILKAIQKNKEEIIVAGPKEKFGVWIKRMAPGLFSKYISNNKIV
jgi:short-subunit dehydrogenase